MGKCPIFFLSAILCWALTLTASADITVPADIGGVSADGDGGTTTPYTYDYSSGALDLDADNILNDLTVTDGNTVLTNITTLSYGAGGGFDFSPTDKRPYLKIYATGHLQAKYIYTYSTNLLENTADAGAVTLVGNSVTVSETIDTGVASKGDQGGHITITTTGGDVNLEQIDSYCPNGGGGNAGQVHITANGSVIVTSNVWAHAAKASGVSNQVVITAGTNIMIHGDVLADGGASRAGGILLDGAGSVTVTGKVSATSKDGHRGEIAISSSSGNVNIIGQINTYQSQGGNPRGAITISAGGYVAVGGDIITYANRANTSDGHVTITADGNVTLDGMIDTHGAQYQTQGATAQGGPVSITSGGNITLNDKIYCPIIGVPTAGYYSTNNAGNITITAAQEIVVGEIDTRTLSTNAISGGGNITIVSTGGDVYLTDTIDTTATAGTNGDLSVSAPSGTITFNDIDISKLDVITLSAKLQGIVITGAIDNLTIDQGAQTVKGGFKDGTLSGHILYYVAENATLTNAPYSILDRDTDADTGYDLVTSWPAMLDAPVFRFR